MFTLTKHPQDVDMIGQAGAKVKVEVTSDMIDAGVAALWAAGIVEHESSRGDRMVICEILQAALGAAGIALRMQPLVWLTAQK